MTAVTDRRPTVLPWMGWLIVALAPHALMALGLGYAGMMSMYLLWPATMGPWALAHARILAHWTGVIGPVAWFSALVWAGLWLVLLRWLRRRQSERAVILLFGLSFFAAAWALWTWMMPPT